MASLPGPSTTPFYSMGKEKENFCRLCQLIMTICSDLFRDTIKHFIKPTDLRSVLDRNQYKLQKIKHMSSHQLQILFPVSGGTPTVVEEMDICLLYTLLRNICNIKPHTNNWGNRPNHGDNSVGACIERIKLMRNSIYGHLKKGLVDDNDFKKYWTELKGDIVEIEKKVLVGNRYEQEVDKLLSCELSDSSANMYVEEFKHLQTRIDDVERSTKRKIASKKARIDCVSRSTKRHIAVKKARVDALERKQMSATNDLKEKLQDMEQHMIYVFQEKISSLEQKIEGKLTAMGEQIEDKLSKMEEKVEGILRTTILLPSASQTLSFQVKYHDITRIIYVKSGQLWVESGDDLIQVDHDGCMLDIVDSQGPHCITEDGALLFANKGENGNECVCITKKTFTGTTTLIEFEKWQKVLGIYSSLINSDILLLTDSGTFLFSAKITRYDKNGVTIRDIMIDNWGHKPVNCDRVCITENRNSDIILACDEIKEVLGMDRSGGHRFRYFNPEGLTPKDICADKNGHILVAYQHNVHLLDEDGMFQKILLGNTIFIGSSFSCLCFDEKQNLYVGDENCTMNVYKYTTGK